jgi:hypothetical protein
MIRIIPFIPIFGVIIMSFYIAFVDHKVKFWGQDEHTELLYWSSAFIQFASALAIIFILPEYAQS